MAPEAEKFNWDTTTRGRAIVNEPNGIYGKLIRNAGVGMNLEQC